MPVKTNISMSQVREMHELYQRGASYREVGEQFGVGGSRVGQLFSEAGLPTRPPGKPKKAQTRPDRFHGKR